MSDAGARVRSGLRHVMGGAERAGPATLLALLAALLLAGCLGERQGAALDPAALGPQPTPERALLAYVGILERGLADPDLPLYTPATRRLLAGSRMTRDQQRSELRQLRRALDSVTVRQRGDLAVARFGPAHPRSAPYFFRRDPTGWRLDLDTASRVIVFGRKNEWRFRTREHEYGFAFEE